MNSGIRGGLFEKKHSDAIGEAVFLYGWLITRQTKPNGLVLGGHAFTWDEISAESGWPRRTLQRWSARLQPHYIEVKQTLYSKLIFRICNPKKHVPIQMEFPPSAPHLAHMTAPGMAHISAGSGALKQGALDGDEKTGVNPRAKTETARAISSTPDEGKKETRDRAKVEAKSRRLEIERQVEIEVYAGAGPKCSGLHPDYLARKNAQVLAASVQPAPRRPDPVAAPAPGAPIMSPQELAVELRRLGGKLGVARGAGGIGGPNL